MTSAPSASSTSEVRTTSGRPPLWPSKYCSRCGGGGRYSFNLMHGSVCYGCGGTGVQPLNRAIAAIRAEYVEVANAARRPLSTSVEVGDRIALYGRNGHTYGEPYSLACETLSGRIPEGVEYGEVVSIVVTPGTPENNRGHSSSTVDGVRTDFWHGAVAMDLRLPDGSIRHYDLGTYNLLIRDRKTDRTPYAERAAVEAAKVSAREAKRAAKTGGTR